MISESWVPSTRAVPLAQGHTQIYRLNLLQEGRVVDACCDILDSSERACADRLRYPELNRRFVVARGALRSILGYHLGEDPASLRFERNQYGKPSISATRVERSLHFNLSTSGAHGIIGLSQDSELGIDIEQLKPVPDASRIAKLLFAENERHVFDGLRDGNRDHLFLRLWTRKEAVVKAEGGGLSISLDGFSVIAGVDSDEGAMVHLSQLWRVFDVDCGMGCVAALAISCKPARVSCYEWSTSVLS